VSDEVFVPAGFTVPDGLTAGGFRLEPLGPRHNATDYAAWTASIGQAAGILAVDFLHMDTVLLNRLYVLAFIGHGTRRMHRVLILGEAHLRAVLTRYQAHYNTARPHQGIAQHVPDDERETRPTTVTDVDAGQIRRKPVLNGLINEYARAA
jgi:hypothetical protein